MEQYTFSCKNIGIHFPKKENPDPVKTESGFEFFPLEITSLHRSQST